MIVVSIIGILAAAASPMYIDYTIRSQIADGMSVAAGAKSALAEYYQEYGSFPADNTAAALSPPATIHGNYVSSVSVSGSAISITYGNKAHSSIAGQTVVWTANDATGSLVWACASGGVIQAKHLPKSCE